MFPDNKNFIDLFIEIGILYRKIQFVLQKKLIENNISTNDIQTIILYLLNVSPNTAEKISKNSYLMISNVLFNLMSLEELDFIIDENKSLDNKFQYPIKLSKKGEDIVNKINKITKNLPVENNFYTLISKYHKIIEKF
ncbi:hypothetical protein AB836_00595 [Rickettsiales bacterium (ex Bugula neritina AB1)]|nr:hypothetical protein AB836_00595 [Rickettsiales bacterium (ex Bugula neritina AB1)]